MRAGRQQTKRLQEVDTEHREASRCVAACRGKKGKGNDSLSYMGVGCALESTAAESSSGKAEGLPVGQTGQRGANTRNADKK